jgi:hypothetical protein
MVEIVYDEFKCQTWKGKYVKKIYTIILAIYLYILNVSSRITCKDWSIWPDDIFLISKTRDDIRHLISVNQTVIGYPVVIYICRGTGNYHIYIYVL